MTTFEPAPVEVRAPLKLVLAGEYAVLDPEGRGVVAALDRDVIVRGRTRRGGLIVRSPGVFAEPLHAAVAPVGGQLTFDEETDDPATRFARRALEHAYGYAGGLGMLPRGVDLTIDGAEGQWVGDDGTARKLGLGTSAATTVAVIAATLALHGVAIDRPVFRRAVLRLAIAAHRRAQGGLGSGVDVAASVAGAIIEYRRCDPGWLLRREDIHPLDLARGGWPGLRCELTPIPKAMVLLLGYTRQSTSTAEHLARFEAWRSKDRAGYELFMSLSRRASDLLLAGFRTGERQAVVQAIGLARKALRFVGERADFEIETPVLRTLAEIAEREGAAGKLSGAGGGDCGFAIAFDRRVVEQIEVGWRKLGIVPIRARIVEHGLRERRWETSDG